MRLGGPPPPKVPLLLKSGVNVGAAMLSDDTFLVTVAFLPLASLAACLRVSRSWRLLLDKQEDLWTRQCHHAWREKVYVVPALKTMALGKHATEREEADTIRALSALRVEELKEIMRNERIVVNNPGDLVETKDFVNAIVSAREDAAVEEGTTAILLQCPHRLRRAGQENTFSIPELYSKAALRLSLQDQHRTAITMEEITSLNFELRTRSDGPMVQVQTMDPWYLGKGTGKVKFSKDGTFRFSWPLGDNNKPINPFETFGMPNETTYLWNFEYEGRVVRLLFEGATGPQEIVSRHPINNGWVFYSIGTVWTSWPMPKRGSDGMCVDPLLRDSNLSHLPSELKRDF